MKRILAIVLLLCMVLGMLPLASAEETASAEVEVPSEEAYAASADLWKQIDAKKAELLACGAAREDMIRAASRLLEQSDIYAEGTMECFDTWISWFTVDGIACRYSFEEEQTDRGEIEGTPVVVPESGYEHISYRTKGAPAGADVYLIGPFYGVEDSFTDHYKTEAKAVAAATGGTYTLYSYKNATIDNIAYAISNGAIVLVDSHGTTATKNGKTRSYLRLLTGSGITTSDYSNGWAYQDGEKYMVTGDAIASHMTKAAPNSFVWYGICSGMAYNTMSAPIREKGVEACLGYSRTVSFHYDRYWLSSFLDGIIEGMTVAEAVDKMKSEVGRWDRCDESDYNTLNKAISNNKAFPIVVSDEDVYPSDPEGLQSVYSTWRLYSCDHNSISYIAPIAASCTLSGVQDYYLCAECKGAFLDYACTQKIDMQKLTVPATGHSIQDGICTTCGMEERLTLWHFWKDGKETAYTWNVYDSSSFLVETADSGYMTTKVSLSASKDHYMTLNNDIGYKVQSGDVVEIRFKSSKAQTSAGKFLFWYTKVTGQSSFSSNSTKLSASVTFGANEWTTVSFTPTAGDTIYRILLDVFETDSNFNGATLTIDYVYMGPGDKAPSKLEENSLFFDFKNDMTAELRYAGSAYNDRAYDRAYWTKDSGLVSSLGYDGENMILVLAEGGTAAYAQTATADMSLTDMPLDYTPAEDDIVKIRFKTENLQLSAGQTAELRLYHAKNNSGTGVDESDCTVVGTLSSDMLQGEYVTLTAPLCDGFIGASSINAIRPQFVGIQSAGNQIGKIYIDYIYIGQTDEAVDPADCTVTFADENGAELQTLTVSYGAAAEFAGVAPEKAFDENYHYSFAAWVDDQGELADLSSVTSDITVYASYVAVEHGDFALAPEDNEYHSLTCACGYERSQSHGWDKVEIVRNASCTEEGSKSYACECGASRTENIPALGHHEVVDAAVAAGCTSPGLTEGTHCDRCDTVLIARKEIPATGHVNTITTRVAATCTENGSVTVTCNCGEVVSTEIVNALGHSYEASVTLPTCETEGYTTYYCHCGDSYISDQVPALGHNYKCSDVGDENAHLYICANGCGAQYEEAHNWDEGQIMKEPSCTEQGIIHHTCENCGAEKTESTEKGAHITAYSVAIPATCTETGCQKHYYCTVCGDIFADEAAQYPLTMSVIVIPAKGHTEMTFYSAKDASCTESGYRKHYHCGACDRYFADVEGQFPLATEFVNVAPTGHGNTVTVTVAPSCNETGSITESCESCGEVLRTETVPALEHSYGTPADNGNGTHTAACACGDAITEDHNYVNGSCICGAVEVTEPTVDSKISIGETLSLESDLTMNLRIKTSQLTAYDLSTAYLVVERDVYNSDGTMEVETRTLTDYTIKDNRLVFAYTGISAAQMNDEIRVVLHIKDANGKEYMSNQKVTSVAIYSDLMLGASAGNEKLITLIMDMLNYGTAAQIYYKRHADAPVNEAFESFKTYASYASTDLKTALEDMSGTISNGNAAATITQGLDLSTRVGITYKVKLPAGVDAANASLIIKDANGNELESFDLSTGTVDSKGRYCVTFFGSNSREMRRVVYATVTVDGAAISDTYSYTISSYAHTVASTAGMPEALVNLTRLMVIYGDSADAYFA